MATNRSFNAMLQEYTPYTLMMEELTKRSWLLDNTEKDNNWKSGALIVPFEGAAASSFSFGALTDEDDISEYDYQRGEVTSYREIWGALMFHGRDLIEHDGKVPESTFLRILPQQLERFLDNMKQVVSVNLLCGAWFASLTADSTANDGVITVDRPERFSINQKVVVYDSTPTEITGYVRTIDMNTAQIVLYDARTGGAVIDFSANQMTVAANARCYYQGQRTTGFTSLREQLLPASLGGSDTIFGKTKADFPYLQAQRQDGLAITATNILDKIFDFWTTVQQRGRGHASTVVLSFKHLGSIMKVLESGAGAYRHVSTTASVYGYTKIVVFGVRGQLEIVGVHEMCDDIIYFLDLKSFKLYSNEFFRKNVDMDGNYYTKIRATDGFKYICDFCFYGDFVCHAPCRNGILYGIFY